MMTLQSYKQYATWMYNHVIMYKEPQSFEAPFASSIHIHSCELWDITVAYEFPLWSLSLHIKVTLAKERE